MNLFQKQLVAGNGKLFMDQNGVMPEIVYGPRPPAPQKVTFEEFEQARQTIRRRPIKEPVVIIDITTPESVDEHVRKLLESSGRGTNER